MTSHTPHTEPPTHEQRRTVTEEPACNVFFFFKKKGLGIKPVLLAWNFVLNSYAISNYKHILRPHRDPLLHRWNTFNHKNYDEKNKKIKNNKQQKKQQKNPKKQQQQKQRAHCQSKDRKQEKYKQDLFAFITDKPS